MDHSRSRLVTAGAPLLDEQLAKPEHRDEHGRLTQCRQTYREHVVAVFEAWRGLIEPYRSLIDRLAERHDLTTERLLKSSLLCIAVHDIGKLSENFQRMMRAENAADYKVAQQRNVRHEVIAVPVVNWVTGNLGQKDGAIPGNGLLETLAVAGHHKFLSDSCGVLNSERFIQPVDWPGGDPVPNVTAGLELAEAMFLEQGWEWPVNFRSPRIARWLCEQLTGLLDERSKPFCMLEMLVSNRLRESDDAPAFRELFTMMKGLLMIADWMASGSPGKSPHAQSGAIHVSTAALRDHIAEKIEKDRRSRTSLKPFSCFSGFQQRCRDAQGHVLAVAPTGSGKTEAALLWALSQAEHGPVRKLLFLLPTMVTATSLHRRLNDFFEKHGQAVGLVHSTADLIRQDELGEGLDAHADIRKEMLWDRHFFPPVTAATVDQLLTTLLHSGRWPMKTFAAASAAVVIDEVHAYDPHTAGLITLLIEQLAPLGTRFMVMSATMPRDLRTTIANALGDVQTIEDTALMESARNVWTTCETPLTDWVTKERDGTSVPTEDIQKLLQTIGASGKPLRVLIVVNTVKRCQELAEALQEFEPVCYHSKFIFDHRRRKEYQIVEERPHLLIATQVVEVSLDLDYDVLLTECAPIDALIQRAGRVNRPRRQTLGRVVVHPWQDGSDKIYGEPQGVLDATWETLVSKSGQELTEHALIELVETVYGNRRLAEHSDYCEIRNRTLLHQKALSGVLDSPRPDEDDALKRTRLEQYQQVSVIPEDFADEAIIANPADRRRYELKMPVWYLRQFRYEGENPDDLPIVRMRYDSILGGQFLDRQEPTANLIF